MIPRSRYAESHSGLPQHAILLGCECQERRGGPVPTQALDVYNDCRHPSVPVWFRRQTGATNQDLSVSTSAEANGRDDHTICRLRLMSSIRLRNRHQRLDRHRLNENRRRARLQQAVLLAVCVRRTRGPSPYSFGLGVPYMTLTRRFRAR